MRFAIGRKLATHRARGATLVEIIVSAAVLGAAILAISGFLGRLIADRGMIKARTARDLIVARAERAISNPDAIVASIEAGRLATAPQSNINLFQCLRSFNCDPSLFGAPQPVDLYEPTANATPSLIAGAGPPVRFNSDAVSCTAGEPNCVFSVVSQVFASCGVSAAGTVPGVCTDPTSFTFRFQVQSQYQLRGRVLPSVPSDAEYADRTQGGFTLTTAELRARISRGCPPNSSMIGYETTGAPRCRCWGTVAAGTPDRPTACGDFRCPNPAHVVTGVDRDGGPICQLINLATRCWTTVAAPIGNCGINGRIVNIQHGNCVYEGAKKAGNSLTCDNNTITCCRDSAQ